MMNLRRWRLFRRRSLWWPTRAGWGAMVICFLVPLSSWSLFGDRFLSGDRRLPGEVLVVECWIGKEGVRAAAAEFLGGSYSHVVATGLPLKRVWNEEGRSVAELGSDQLEAAGVPVDRILVARASEVDRNRTFEAAKSAVEEMRKRGLRPKNINVFTQGNHARRSRLVFAKAFGGSTRVGVISWLPAGEMGRPWWHSTERTESMITETLSFLFELLLNGGRRPV